MAAPRLDVAWRKREWERLSEELSVKVRAGTVSPAERAPGVVGAHGGCVAMANPCRWCPQTKTTGYPRRMV